jgi:hypothetical protein
MGPEFNDYLMGIADELSEMGASPKMVKYQLRKNYFRIKTAFYEDDNPQMIIDKLKTQIFESIKSDSLITEGSKLDLPVRTVVRDLLGLVKKGPGHYFLPEEVSGSKGMLYIFPKIPTFSVELTVNEDMSINGDYLIDGNTAEDGDEIDVRLTMNPTKFPEAYYDLVADLNDIIAHEMEHVLQDFGYRDVQSDDSEKPTDKEYYKQTHEVPAEIVGFRRIVKLRKESPEKVIRDWFNRNKEVHQLSDEDIEELVSFLTDEYKKKYG